MSQENPKFSIITPNFNSGRKLIATCESVAGQGVEFEHLIMDGESTDGSLQLARQLADADPRVKVFCQKDKGIYDAMNKGIAVATGDYLYFLGAGDVLNVGSLKEMSGYLPGDLKSFVYGDAWIYSRRYDGKFNRRKLFDHNICHQSVFYGREVFQTCGHFETIYPALADWEYNTRCFGSRQIRKIYAPVLVATFEGGGISDSGDRQFHADRSKLFRKNFGQLFMTGVWLERQWSRVRGRLGRVKRWLIPRRSA